MSDNTAFLLQLYLDSKYCDFSIYMRDRITLSAHKCIITRDPIFSPSSKYTVATKQSCDIPLSGIQLSWLLLNIYEGTYNGKPNNSVVLGFNAILDLIGFLIKNTDKGNHPLIKHLSESLIYLLEGQLSKDNLNCLFDFFREYSRFLSLTLCSKIENLLPVDMESLDNMLAILEEEHCRNASKKTKLIFFCSSMLKCFCENANKVELTEKKIQLINRYRKLDPDNNYLPLPYVIQEYLHIGSCTVVMRYILSTGTYIPYEPLDVENKLLAKNIVDESATIEKDTKTPKGTDRTVVDKDYANRSTMNLSSIIYYTKCENLSEVKEKLSKYGFINNITHIYRTEDKNFTNKYLVDFKESSEATYALNVINNVQHMQ